jgi:excinuclease ABC subunit C
MQHFKAELRRCVEALEFEKAEVIKNKIKYLENYQARSIVITEVLRTIDVFTVQKEGPTAYVNYLMVSNGTIIQTKTLKLETHLDETIEETLAFAIAQMRMTFNSEAKEIIVPFPIVYDEAEITLTVPKGGDKKKLIELSEKNVQYFIEAQKAKERLKLDEKGDKSAILLQIQKDLQLTAPPDHIECFDNSNFQGSYPVAAMVCFKHGLPSKKDYRHFNIKTVEGINDFASMKEIVSRRYYRLKEEGASLPQLVIIDGGKGQLNAAYEAIKELELEGKMTMVGLAKNVEEIFFIGDKESLKLPYDSDSLKLIRRIRDEVHRFGITFHRQKRSKGTFKNALLDIKGIGSSTADLLLKTFRSVSRIKEQPIEELAKVIGASKAKIVKSYFDSGEA